MAEFNFGKEAELTNKQLADELAKQSPLTAAEVEKLLPSKIDKKRFEELLTIVNSATSENQKIAALTGKIQELGGVALRILGRFLKPL